MRTDSRVVIDQSIQQLIALAGVLAEELGSASAAQLPLDATRRRCKEALLTVSVLLPKLEAAREVCAER